MNPQASSQEKVAIYIDGSNLYFSVKKTFNCKINLKKFCEKLVGKDNLVKIRDYIAPIEQNNDSGMYAQQQSFLEKIRAIEKLTIVFGRLEKRKRDGKEYYIEKATDVNLALDVALDAYKGEYDKAFLISNDGDFSGAITAAIGFTRKVIYVAIGNNKAISHHLEKVASTTLRIKKEFIEDCILRE